MDGGARRRANVAVLLNGVYPILSTIRRLSDLPIPCVSDEEGTTAEYRTGEDLFRPPRPGDPFSIPRTTL